MVTYFKDKNEKSKKEYKKFEILATILKSLDTFVIIATTSSALSMSLTGIGFIVIPISSAILCGLIVNNKVIYEIVVQKYNKYKDNMKKIKKQ